MTNILIYMLGVAMCLKANLDMVRDLQRKVEFDDRLCALILSLFWPIWIWFLLLYFYASRDNQ